MFNYYEFKEDTNITTLELFKADGTSLGELKHAYNRSTKLSLGSVSELSFNLPNVATVFNIIIHDDNTLAVPDISNEDIGKTAITLIGYEIKATYSNGLEIMYLLPNKTIESDMLKTDISFTCYSREYELSRKLLMDYRGVLLDGEYVLDGLSLEEVVRDILGGTFWNVKWLDEGYNNTDQKCMRRTIEAFNGVSKLAAIDSVCKTFGAIPEYDTINRNVYFYRADNADRYKYNGLNIEANNYLKTAKQSKDLAEIVTRLYGTGNNNLTVNGVNPTGVSYIEDLSYFIYPAKLNDDKTGLTQSSRYMSDALALAELKYEDKVISTQEQFKILYAEKDTLNATKIQLENELTNLQTELNVINDYIDVAYVGMNTAVESNTDYVKKRTEKEVKEKEIADKRTAINNTITSIENINTQLTTLYNDLKIENNFTNSLLKERENYIYEGSYSNTGISIEQDLYDEMVEYLQSKKEPKVVVEIELNSMFSMKSKEAQIDKQKIVLGEKVDVYYKFRGADIDIQAQILELTINEEANTIEVTIANAHDYKKDAADYLENILQRSITTSTMVENNVIDWNKGKIALDDIDDLYEKGISSAKIQIEGAADNSVIFNERGITIKNTTEPLRFLRATNGVLALTKDGGRTYSTAITPEGVWAERLIGQMFVGNALSIIGGNNSELNIANIPAGTYSDRKLDNTAYGDDFGIVLKSDVGNVYMTRERGFKITNSKGENTFIADNSGNMYLKGTIVTDSATITGGSLTIGSKFSVLNDGSLSASGINVEGTINATNLSCSNGTIGGFKIDQWNLIGGTGTSQVGICSTSGKNYAFWAGSSDSSSAPFRVGHDGNLWCNNAYIKGQIEATSGTFQNCTVTGSCNIQCSVAGNLVTSGINASNITAGSLSAGYISGGTISASNINLNGGTVKLRTNGHVEFTNNTGFFTMGPAYGSAVGVTHPYMSAINLAYGSGVGLNFLSSTDITSAGSNVGYIRCAPDNYRGATYQLNIKGDDGVEIASPNASIYLWSKIELNAKAANSVWAYGNNLSSGRVKTTEGDASSRILKENIQEFTKQDYQDAYQLLQDMKLYNYDYKYRMYKDKHQYGFIIDDIEELDNGNKFFRFDTLHAKIEDGNRLNPSVMDDEDFDVDKLDDNYITYKEYDADVLDKYMLACLKAMQQKINQLEEKLNGK